MATFMDFDIIYKGPRPLGVAKVVRDNMTPSGLLELCMVEKGYIHLGCHRFNDEYYEDMLDALNQYIIVDEHGGEYRIEKPQYKLKFELEELKK